MPRALPGVTDDPSLLGLAYTRGHGLPDGWKSKGRCHGQATHVFFSVKREDIKMALTLCAMCPVQWDCAAYALNADEPDGTWAMSLKDRKWLRKQPDAHKIVEQASFDGVPVQFAVRRARTAKLTT